MPMQKSILRTLKVFTINRRKAERTGARPFRLVVTSTAPEPADDISKVPGGISGQIGRRLAFKVDPELRRDGHGQMMHLVDQRVEELGAAGRVKPVLLPPLSIRPHAWRIIATDAPKSYSRSCSASMSYPSWAKKNSTCQRPTFKACIIISYSISSQKIGIPLATVLM